jgi:hypothetical protein
MAGAVSIATPEIPACKMLRFVIHVLRQMRRPTQTTDHAFLILFKNV